MVGPLAPSARMRHFRFSADLRVDHALHRRRHQHVAGQRQHLRGIEVQLVGETGDAAMRTGMRIKRGNIEAVGIVQRAGVIADRDHLQPVLMQLQRRIGADIAKTLDDGGGVAGLDLQLLHHPLGEMGDAAPGRLAPAERAAGGDRLAGDDLGDGPALVHGIGVHEPGHHLLVGAHVGRHHVGVRPDEGDHLLHVAARQRLQLALARSWRDRHSRRPWRRHRAARPARISSSSRSPAPPPRRYRR